MGSEAKFDTRNSWLQKFERKKVPVRKNFLVEQLGCKKFFSTKTVLKVSPQKSWLKTNWGSFFLCCFQVVALKLFVLEVKRMKRCECLLFGKSEFLWIKT